MFAPMLLFSKTRYPMMSFKVFSCRPPLLWQQIFGQNWL